MNAMARRTAIGVGALMLLVGGFFAVFERKEITVVDPPSGPAASNAFFALEGVLSRAGKTVQHGSHLPDVYEYDAIAIGGSLATLDANTSEWLLEWVEEGGTLVVRAGTERDMKDAPFWKALASQGIASAKTGCATLAGADADPTMTLCGRRVTVPHGPADRAIGDDGGAVLLVHPMGDGRLVVMASMTPLVFRGLNSPAAQRLATRIFRVDGSGGSVFLAPRLDGPSVWSMLFARGWPMLLAATLLLVAWASRQSMRLGPAVEAPSLDRRSLLEHVQAAGEFLYARDRGRSLHRRVCAAVLARIRRHDPAVADLEGDALHEHLAERYRLAPAQLARAFDPPADAQAFRESILLLARLRRHP